MERAGPERPVAEGDKSGKQRSVGVLDDDVLDSLDMFGHTSIEFREGTSGLRRQEIDGSDITVSKLLLGYSIRTPGGAPISLSVGIGATDDAPDSDLTFRFPVNLFN